MKKTFLPLTVILWALLTAAAWPVRAAGPSPEQEADWERRLQEARSLQEQGAARKARAKEVYEARSEACFDKFRVNARQYDAKQEYVQATHEARRVENQGKALERAVRKERLADKDARRLAEAPRRQAELAAGEVATQADREAAEERRQARLLSREERAEAGAGRREAEEERLRRKQESHQRKVAEKMEKARRREAESP